MCLLLRRLTTDMAIMIPSEGGYFDPYSKEREMFEALSHLSDDYYVFHSYRLVNLVPDRGLNENEIDFLVFNPNYGCLFIECKNRTLKREADGQWKYLNQSKGDDAWEKMQDPFNQAFSGQHNLYNKLFELYPKHREKLKKCKFMVAVWLPKYTKKQVDENDFGPNIIKELIMTREAMLYPEETCKQVNELMERMNRIHLVCKFEQAIIDGRGYLHSLSPTEAMSLFKEVFCPTFKTIVDVKKDFEDTNIELLEEQFVVLNFLAHQRTAAISGAGGTGKTLIAIHRAELLSNRGEKVLFLCYNHNLKIELERNKKTSMANVDFYTLDAFACKKCGTSYNEVNYQDLKAIIENEIIENSFEYKHIIVDEGQDFGRRSDKETPIRSEILALLSQYGAGEYGHSGTSFFIFYDKNQLVNSKELPIYLNNVDSKLTLYKNCRNTKNIAATAYSLIKSAPITHDRAWNGDPANFIFYTGEDELATKVDNIIEESAKETNTSRVIISCSDDVTYSGLKSGLLRDTDGRNYIYKSTSNKKTKLYTSSTFKGLEADTVLVTDITNKTFEDDNCNFYVAATRARRKLYIFIDKDKVDLKKVLESRFPKAFDFPDETKKLSLAMHGKVR